MKDVQCDEIWGYVQKKEAHDNGGPHYLKDGCAGARCGRGGNARRQESRAADRVTGQARRQFADQGPCPAQDLDNM